MLRPSFSTWWVALASSLCVGPALCGALICGLKAPSRAVSDEIAYPPYSPSAPLSKPLPVLYLFRGASGAERDCAVAGQAKETLDGVIAGGRVKPLLVVMTMAENSWYVD